VLRGSQIEDAPPAPDQFSWEGFYFGALVGTSRTEFTPDTAGLQRQLLALRNNLPITQQYSILGAPLFDARSDSGMNFGGYAGYNMAFGDAIIGFEADYNRLDHRYRSLPQPVALVSGTMAPNVVAATVGGTQTLEDYMSFRLRLGYAMGRFMPFGTLGFAVGRGTSTVFTVPDPAANTPHLASFARAKNSYTSGITGGFGLDAALTDNLILRAEYIYTRFADMEGTVVDINNIRVGAALKF
jgi:opacity protein-like surface antigen